jgi:hypothetical protein
VPPPALSLRSLRAPIARQGVAAARRASAAVSRPAATCAVPPRARGAVLLKGTTTRHNDRITVGQRSYNGRPAAAQRDDDAAAWDADAGEVLRPADAAGSAGARRRVARGGAVAAAAPRPPSGKRGWAARAHTFTPADHREQDAIHLAGVIKIVHLLKKADGAMVRWDATTSGVIGDDALRRRRRRWWCLGEEEGPHDSEGGGRGCLVRARSDVLCKDRFSFFTTRSRANERDRAAIATTSLRPHTC